MLPRLSGIIFTSISRATCLIVLVLILAPASFSAEPKAGSVVCREDFPTSRREQLARKLRKISGLDLRFDNDGILRASRREIRDGSTSASALLVEAISGRNPIVLEDSSDNSDVAFCRVISGRLKNNPIGPPVFVVQIDFADFDQVVGDKRALAAFNEGWGLLHEIEHIVHDSADGTALDETGECEARINQMRRECSLPERVDYFYALAPFSTGSTFLTRFVRLAFEEIQPTKKKKRFWVTWDAKVVGGLEPNQLAALR